MHIGLITCWKAKYNVPNTFQIEDLYQSSVESVSHFSFASYLMGPFNSGVAFSLLVSRAYKRMKLNFGWQSQTRIKPRCLQSCMVSTIEWIYTVDRLALTKVACLSAPARRSL